jgi:hypothetical protein
MAHVAVFGASGRAHSLISSTVADPSAASALRFYTDLPRHGEGAPIDPFVAGYPSGDYYVFQRTEPDHDAPRAGMVRTVSLLIKLSTLTNIDLRSVLDLLPQIEGDEPVGLDRLSAKIHDDPALGAVALAQALIEDGRAAWIGDGGYRAIASVWSRLSTGDRADLRFGLAFHPGHIALPDAGLTVVVVPERYASRWQDWPNVTCTTRSEDRSAMALLGSVPSASIGEFVAQFFGGPVPLDQWPFVVRGADGLRELDALDHEQTRALAQVLGFLAPLARDGRALKQRVEDRLLALAPLAAAEDVRGLRAIPWNAYRATGLEEHVDAWAHAVIADETRTDELVKTHMAAAAAKPDDMSARMLDGLSGALSEDRPSAIRHLLNLARTNHNADVASWIVGQIGTSVSDSALAKGRPSRDDETLADFAASQRLPLTFAKTVPTGDPVAAWARLAQMKDRPAEAENTLAKRLGPDGVVAAATATGDETLIARAAQQLDRKPALLSHQLDRPAGRAILAHYVRDGGDLWRVVTAARAAEVLLGALLEGDDVQIELLEALADSPGADISDFPRRADVWPVLPEPARTKMLDATASSLALTLGEADPPLESPLSRAMLRPDIFGDIAHDHPGQALALIRLLPGTAPKHAVLVAERGRLSDRESRDLGRVMFERGWKAAVGPLIELAEQRRDLQPAARVASKLLGVVDRYRLQAQAKGVAWLGLKTTVKDFRDAVFEMAVDLYPRGPADGDIWERAGGNLADLPTASTPRQAWSRALTQVKRGSTGAPAITALVDVMIADFPANPAVQGLAHSTHNERSKT